jgi:hypothetical protein
LVFDPTERSCWYCCYWLVLARRFVSNCSVLLLTSQVEGRVRFAIGLSCNWIVLLVSCDAGLLHFLLISDLVCWMGLFSESAGCWCFWCLLFCSLRVAASSFGNFREVELLGRKVYAICKERKIHPSCKCRLLPLIWRSLFLLFSVLVVQLLRDIVSVYKRFCIC